MSQFKVPSGRFPSFPKIPSFSSGTLLPTPDRSQNGGSAHHPDIQAPYGELGSHVNQGNERHGSGRVRARRETSEPDETDSLGRSVSMNDVAAEVGEDPARTAGAHTYHDSAYSLAGPSGPSPSGGYGSPEEMRAACYPFIAVDGDAHSDTSNSSGHWLRKFSDIPLRVRGRAEAWEVPREQIRMGAEVGRGTGGVVYTARWRGLECAAKLLCTNSQVSVEYHDMINEITVISHLRHPNLVLFLGACTINEPLLILSELMAGGSLEDRYNGLRRKHGKPWQPQRLQLYKWMVDLARAVCFLHSCGNPIMHRDLKPSNLLLSEHDHLKVSDFGLCKTMQKVKEDGSPYSMTGCTGTKRYMAPEVVLSKPDYDLKVDVYSMAMIFWYMAKGERPFEQVEPQLISVLASTRGLRPDAKAIRWAPVENLVEQMWEDDPQNRPTCSDILITLKGLGADLESEVDSDSGFHCNVKARCNCAIM